jgi:hypothetical protein
MDAKPTTTKAASTPTPQKRDWGAFLIEEAKSFAVIFIYLAFVFGIFSLHQWLVLSAKGIDYQFYGVALLNALILAKIILIAENFSFADGLRRQPLVYRVIYKSLAFTALLILVHMAEELFFGRLHGDSAAAVMAGIGNGSFVGALALAVILCFALLPFFFFRELARQIGPAHLKEICFSALPPI